MARDGEGGETKGMGDHGRGHIAFGAMLIKEGVQGCGRGSMVGVEMGDPSHGSANGVGRWLVVSAVREFLTFHTILLIGEGERNKGGAVALSGRGKVGVKDMHTTDFKFDIL